MHGSLLPLCGRSHAILDVQAADTAFQMPICDIRRQPLADDSALPHAARMHRRFDRDRRGNPVDEGRSLPGTVLERQCASP